MSKKAKESQDRNPEKVLTPDDIFRIHKKLFGVDPKITGALYWESDTLIDRILDAIDKGEPYVEPDIPDGVVI